MSCSSSLLMLHFLKLYSWAPRRARRVTVPAVTNKAQVENSASSLRSRTLRYIVIRAAFGAVESRSGQRMSVAVLMTCCHRCNRPLTINNGITRTRGATSHPYASNRVQLYSGLAPYWPSIDVLQCQRRRTLWPRPSIVADQASPDIPEGTVTALRLPCFMGTST